MSACCETPAFKPPSASPQAATLKTVVLIGPPKNQQPETTTVMVVI